MSETSLFKILSKDDLSFFLDFTNRIENSTQSRALPFAKKSLEESLPEVCIAAEFKNDKIITILLGYSINACWFSDSYRNIMPYWVIGSLQTSDIANELPHEKIDILTTLVTDEFEKLGFESMYVVIKVSNKVNMANSKRYIERYHRVRKYSFIVEKLYYHDTYDYQKMCSLYKLLSYEQCEENKCLAILKYTLRDEFRKNI